MLVIVVFIAKSVDVVLLCFVLVHGACMYVT